MFEVLELNAGYEFRNRFVHAVRNVSFKVEQDDFFGIAGESGCGKTTLMLASLGLLKKPGKVISGRVLVEGLNLLALSNDELKKVRWKKVSSSHRVR